MNKVTISKRILLMFLVCWITFISVFSAYQETTYCAEWVAGTIATIGAGPMLTALLIGGVVVAGGVAVYKIATTDAEDYRDFASGIKQGFNEFVAEQEKQILLEQNQSLTEQEASDQGVAIAREKVNEFFDSAITTTKNTVKNLPLELSRYWNLYSKIIGNVADNGIGSDSALTPTTPVRISRDYSGLNINMTGDNNVGANVGIINGTKFIQKGVYKLPNNVTYDSNYLNDTAIPFICINFDDRGNGEYNASCLYCRYSPENNILTQINSTSFSTSYPNEGADILRNIMQYTTIAVICVQSYRIEGVRLPDYLGQNDNYKTVLGLGSGTGDEPKTWERTIKNTLDNTKMGDAIQTGRRQLVNDGDYITGVFQEDSIPVNKSGVSVNEGVATGSIGWQIPQNWDDYYAGGIPFKDVVGGTGAMGVPYDDIIDPDPTSDSVDFPEDTPVQDTADYPLDDSNDPTADPDKPQEIPEKPSIDVFENQGGTYYPTAMDLTTLFPFCIPFDVIYLVEKFDVNGEQAPVITIPIVYPQAIRGAMGSDRYEVVIDFQDFLIVRNILRTFLLILFIVGLMKVTRDLIRG